MSPCHRKVGWEAHAMAALPSLSQAVSSLLRASGPQLRDAGQESIPPPPPSYSDTMTTITTELPIRWPAWLLHASQTHRFVGAGTACLGPAVPGARTPSTQVQSRSLLE